MQPPLRFQIENRKLKIVNRRGSSNQYNALQFLR
jgi:hypothetical protein